MPRIRRDHWDADEMLFLRNCQIDAASCCTDVSVVAESLGSTHGGVEDCGIRSYGGSCCVGSLTESRNAVSQLTKWPVPGVVADDDGQLWRDLDVREVVPEGHQLLCLGFRV